jgi:hypothetical protein
MNPENITLDPYVYKGDACVTCALYINVISSAIFDLCRAVY